MDFRASGAEHIAHLSFCTVKRRTGQCRPAQQADQGSHYTGDHFQRLLAEQGIMCRLRRVGVFVCADWRFIQEYYTGMATHMLHATRSQ